MGLRASLFAALVVLAGMGPQGAAAQDGLSIQSPILVIESDQLYLESAFGQRIADEIAAENAQIISENQRIAEELEAEEQALTTQRPDLEPAVFRDMADAFDDKVRSIRRTQEAKARRIARKQDDSRREFLTAAAPILEQMMLESGAAVILERRNVLLFRNAVDITRAAIVRVNAEIADGTSSLPKPTED